ncbi:MULTISPECIES: tRNA lysidine(34) synthetase TilS [Vibrio diabolicus subgroup]|uniref:tRNA(Ile)-lysidine synthase n=1 Tax=Vibrio diabolicus TaxID=50719 RepID=A0AA92R7G9_9VIBR|nr:MULTISPECIES: tRNA lysidine(34) synthetase TilS [Vibrio diabolicus subgroup]RCW22147.1 tRNA(Ile)-lysidine synthase [Vibrio parahaemolyticus]MCG6224047.1 tRNA lysidine(34) synthetase TilS [Vibrio diabolicus]MCR9685890.1 tRNA lysidine(34) synthetase TilS [Vibrio antiquarius]MDV5058180.1 tRNA lysidine(34) synthetase TilS [Vibrio diabolicus]QRG83587.1 tRNA lysidine(34) synthetase TilS [Vibrio diabolicus]
MESLYPHFAQVLGRYYKSGTKVVLAFSGGVDSRLLLELLSRYQQAHSIECHAVYVHHGLSSNADDWADKCLLWAKQVGISCSIERVSLDISNGESIELLAREARYQALTKYIQEGDILLTGQHADDQLETFLLALKRGSGPKGLSSMAESMPFSSGSLVRPLLTIKRKSIEDAATKLGLEWVEDESNQDTRYDRNFLRHCVIPELSGRWPSIHQAVQRSASLCAQQEALLDELLSAVFEHALQTDLSLSIEELAKHSELARARLIRMWLAKLNTSMPTQVQLNLIWNEVALAQQDANPKLQLKQGEVRRFRNRLYWVTEIADVTEWQSTIQVDTVLSLPERLGELTLTTSSSNATIALPSQPELLRVTFNPEGLSAHPTTRNHSRKLKKLFQEYNVPSWLRRQIPILMYQDRVVAVADLFVDQAFNGQDCELIWRR